MARFTLTRDQINSLSHETCSQGLFLIAAELARLAAETHGSGRVNACVARYSATLLKTSRKTPLGERALQSLAFEEAREHLQSYGKRIIEAARESSIRSAHRRQAQAQINDEAGPNE